MITKLSELSNYLVDRSPITDGWEFDVAGAVSYASIRRGILVISKEGRSCEIPCPPDCYTQLAEISIGDSVRVRGALSGTAKYPAITALERNEEDFELEVVEARIHDDQLKTRHNKYARFTGSVEEVFVAEEETLFVLRQFTHIHGRRLIIRLDRSYSREELYEVLNRTFIVHGLFRRHGDRFEMLLQNEDQIAELNGAQWNLQIAKPKEPGLYCVVYSEPSGRMICATPSPVGPRFVFLKTYLSSEFERGDFIGIDWTSDDGQPQYATNVRFRKSRFLCLTDERQPDLEFGDNPRLFPEAAIQPSTPFTVLDGKVIGKSRQGDVTNLLLETESGFEVMVYCPIVSFGASVSDVRVGDSVEVDGVYFRHLTQDAVRRRVPSDWRLSPNPQDFEYSMYVDGPDFIRLQQRPLMLSRTLLLFFALGGLIVLILGVVWNQTLKTQVASRTAKLTAVQSHLSKSFEAAKEAIVLNDSDGSISQSNRRFRNLIGRDDIEGLTIRDCLSSLAECLEDPSAFEDMCDKVLDQQQQGTVELELGGRSLLVYASPITAGGKGILGNYWTFQDVTKERKLEREYLQAQKMEAVGRLSGGIAHDFNNVLTVIGSNMILLSYLAEEYEIDIREYAKPIESSVRRAADLTRQLLDFSRKTQLSFRVLDVNEVVQGVFNIVRRSLDASIHVNLFMSPEPLPIKLDLASLEQVLMNLCINASDAIGPLHGTIRIRTSLANHPLLGSCACLSVEDDGEGMTEAVKERIFEPFFTTKARGVGTGLGLSTAFGIIQQHEGDIVCESTLGKGTKFALYFPICDEQIEEGDAFSGSSKYEAETPLTLLLVDDDPLLRAAGTRILSALGHNVLTAENGRVALEVLERQDAIDAVLLDLIMPEMTGNECYDIIRERWPELPIAICSGYSASRIKVRSTEKVAFLAKPYRISQLCETIDKLTH
ncbi:MAG: ATP-binding protein [Aureliella sp.]